DIAHIIHTSRKDGFLAVTLFEEKEKVDVAYRILNLSIQLLQNGTDSYFRELTLETEIQKFLQHHTINDDVLKKVLLIKKLIPIIEKQDTTYLLELSTYFCPKDTYIQIYMILKQYLEKRY